MYTAQSILRYSYMLHNEQTLSDTYTNLYHNIVSECASAADPGKMLKSITVRELD